MSNRKGADEVGTSTGHTDRARGSQDKGGDGGQNRKSEGEWKVVRRKNHNKSQDGSSKATNTKGVAAQKGADEVGPSKLQKSHAGPKGKDRMDKYVKGQCYK